MGRQPEFNESTYGAHVTSEITFWLKGQGLLDAVPFLPTIRDEASLGYDASFTASWGMIYLQFKLPEFMRRANAAEFSQIGSSYFRFSVKTKATKNYKIQHNTLCDLEEAQSRLNGIVCYMAPAFLSAEDLLKRIHSEKVVDGSIYASPCHLGRVREGSLHRYAYTGLDDVRPFSEPLPPRSGRFREAVANLSELAYLDAVPLEQYLSNCWDSLATMSGIQIGSEVPLVRRVLLSATALDLQPILVRQVGTG